MGSALEEHYSYLSDGIRLERYEQAVALAVMPGDSVADIGCGFGILGLMCLKAGASHVWGIDETPAIQIAAEAMARSGFDDRYTCLHESSFKSELPAPVDVLICDHVGYFGFDYGIIKTMGDARRRLLKDGGKILPQQIRLEVAAVQSDSCRELANAWAKAPVPADYRWLREYGVNTKHGRDFLADELVARPETLGTIDLREDGPDALSFFVQLDILRGCDLDGLAGWFACEIFDGVWMTNSPVAPARIKRSQAFLPFASPLSVIKGDKLEVNMSVRHEENIISWSARVARTGQASRQSTWASTILDPRDRTPPAESAIELSREGEARRDLLGMVDGRLTGEEIELEMLARYADLYPSIDLVAAFVRSEICRSAR
ncbi:MAG: 50S ribosomal protein L11 methyltransferase [Croceibacterium sp.]